MKLEDLECRENIDVEEYYSYFLKVQNDMKEPSWLGDLKKDDIKYLIDNGSKTWCFFLDNKFVCSYMYIVTDKRGIEHLGLNYKEEECADCGPMFVEKEYRGNKLQYQMFKKLEQFCFEKGLKYIITTAHPDNIYSSNNMEKAGYKNVGYKNLERGPRNIYVREICN